MLIRKLSKKLVNQISVGEIIRGPSSIVKELLENSLDAKANRILIEIKKGGIDSIIINDNGFGISKKELILAISSYSTSKIVSLKDLHNITTFGFRGEALFNMSLVSRLELISRTNFQKEGWKIYLKENERNKFFIEPKAHLTGTTVKIFDLFYNCPIRRNFIKKTKVEFSKIVKIVDMIALSENNTSFVLKHNGKLIKEYLVNNKKDDNKERIKAILGEIFFKTLLKIKFKEEEIELSGWIQKPTCKIIDNNQKIRLFYVNKRFVRSQKVTFTLNKIIKKIKKYDSLNISYILFLKIPTNLVDVNYHPTKSEILFGSSFKIYNFFYRAISSFLLKEKNFFSFLNLYEKQNRKELSIKKILGYNNFLHKILNLNKNNRKIFFSFGKIIAFIKNCYVLTEKNGKFFLISLPDVKLIMIEHNLDNDNYIDFKKKYLIFSKKFFFPIDIKLMILNYQGLFFKLGFDYLVSSSFIEIKSIPKLLEKNNIINILTHLFSFLRKKKKNSEVKVINYFLFLLKMEIKENWGRQRMYQILQEMEEYSFLIFNNLSKRFLRCIDINSALSVFENEKKY
ncbi:DNA mismatch repair endonuclease MutL [Buchnera aphidicola (Mindarus keteleerifoliae)]|uniref:DNA mismatch repair endonuclease MutL n=1 Tax=Buchnera aphidicola TaxID=9 RepID=UPI0031B71267